MNTKTVGQKMDELFTEIKIWAVRILLIAWAFVTFALGVCYGFEKRKSNELEERVNKIESMSNYSVEDLKGIKVIYIHK